MNKNLKKILTATIISVSGITTIGCASPNSNLANKINNGMNDFVSSINKLDYVETNKKDNNLGKIVSAANENIYNNQQVSEIENTITRPSEREDNFKLYVLSESPFVTFASDEENNRFAFSFQFSREKIENTSEDINYKINQLILKRAILMVYVNEIYNGNVNITSENRTAINAYVNVIKENASYLNGNRGMVKNQLGIASNLIEKQSNENLVNYYLIKSGEALEIRSNKIDSTISAIDSIISILENNLLSSSTYYQNNLSNLYNNMISNIENNPQTTSENQQLAKDIADSIDFIKLNNNDDKTNITQENKEEISRNQIKENTNDLQKNNYDNQLNNQTKSNTIDNKNLTISNTNQTNDNISKTQNNTNIIENNDKFNKINDENKLSPSARARIRRRRMQQNSERNSEIVSEQSKTNNQISNQSNQSNVVTFNNPTVKADRPTITSDEINNRSMQLNRTPENLTKQDETQPTSSSTIETNRATRVPYKVNTTSFTE